MISQPAFTEHLQVPGAKLGLQYRDAKSLLGGIQSTLLAHRHQGKLSPI